MKPLPIILILALLAIVAFYYWNTEEKEPTVPTFEIAEPETNVFNQTIQESWENNPNAKM